MIERILQEQIAARTGQGKAIIILGARQVGKTTMLRQMYGDNADVVWLNGDEQDVRSMMANASSTFLRAVIGKKTIVVIDEAQRIEDVGLKLKLIIDDMPEVQVVVTGSSLLDLANKTNEPLTGRKWEYKMFPLSFGELAAHGGLLEEKRLLPIRLVYGSYPDVAVRAGDERRTLSELADSYLYRDILTFDRIKKSDKLVKLLQALALQMGSEVSYNELSQTCGLDPKTIDSYVNLLEQSFIIFRLGSYSRKLRNELKFARKIYFWDCGIRNAIIGNFQPAETRSDVGALFENYIISERLKKLHYEKSYAKGYFWRTAARQEIDYIEEVDGQLSSYEIKWNPRRHPSAPLSWARAYPDASFEVITRENYEAMLM